MKPRPVDLVHHYSQSLTAPDIWLNEEREERGRELIGTMGETLLCKLKGMVQT